MKAVKRKVQSRLSLSRIPPPLLAPSRHPAYLRVFIPVPPIYKAGRFRWRLDLRRSAPHSRSIRSINYELPWWKWIKVANEPPNLQNKLRHENIMKLRISKSSFGPISSIPHRYIIIVLKLWIYITFVTIEYSTVILQLIIAQNGATLPELL